MRPLLDSPFLHGLHEPGGEGEMEGQGRPGWLLFTEGIGADPGDESGHDYRPWSDRSFGILSRLNHGYHPNGTLPHSSHYGDFARRCANFVAASPGCKMWIIGNETNLAAERPRIPGRGTPPGGDDGGPRDATDPLGHGDPGRFNLLHDVEQPARSDPNSRDAPPSNIEAITPALYEECFRRCRDAIRSVPGHANDHVIVGGVAPWNNQTSYPGNENGDWVRYLRDILSRLGPGGCDGVALHTYTHGTDPALITNDKRMDPPFQNRHYHFLAYRDFMDAIPANMRHLGVYITEADQDEPWLDQNNGWVQRAYEEIDRWNGAPGHQQIRALILYRYPNLDRWVIEGKGGVLEAFRDVVGRGYRWNPADAATGVVPLAHLWRPGSALRTATTARVRRSPGRNGKPADDILAEMPAESALTLLTGGPTIADGLAWWPVRGASGGGPAAGWMADAAPDGTVMLTLVSDAAPFTPGEEICNVGDGQLNMRGAAGLTGAIVARVPAGATATVLEGPTSADGLTWWRSRFTDVAGSGHEGWLAERAPDGLVLLASTAYRWPGISGVG